jgi:hypothetical protein
VLSKTYHGEEWKLIMEFVCRGLLSWDEDLSYS